MLSPYGLRTAPSKFFVCMDSVNLKIFKGISSETNFEIFYKNKIYFLCHAMLSCNVVMASMAWSVVNFCAYGMVLQGIAFAP